MRNAIQVPDIEVVAVNEYVISKQIVDVKLIHFGHYSPFIDLDYMVRNSYKILPEMHN
jgi:hypothetical protein